MAVSNCLANASPFEAAADVVLEAVTVRFLVMRGVLDG